MKLVARKRNSRRMISPANNASTPNMRVVTVIAITTLDITQGENEEPVQNSRWPPGLASTERYF